MLPARHSPAPHLPRTSPKPAASPALLSRSTHPVRSGLSRGVAWRPNVRTTRTVALTPAGERLVPHARAVRRGRRRPCRPNSRTPRWRATCGSAAPRMWPAPTFPAILTILPPPPGSEPARPLRSYPAPRRAVRNQGFATSILIKQDPERVLPGPRLLRHEPLRQVGLARRGWGGAIRHRFRWSLRLPCMKTGPRAGGTWINRPWCRRGLCLPKQKLGRSQPLAPGWD